MFINYANPMTANCWAIRQATGVAVVGLCHGVFHIERSLADFIGAPVQEVTRWRWESTTSLYLRFRWQGRDALALCGPES